MKLGAQEIVFIVAGLLILAAVLWVGAKIKKSGASNNTTNKPG